MEHQSYPPSPSSLSPPPIPHLLLILLLSLLAYPLLKALYNLSPLHPLSAYPSAPLWSSTRLTWILSLHRGTLHTSLHTLHTRHGPVVRIAPNELSYTDPRAWRDIYVATTPAATTAGGAGALFERNQVWARKPRAQDPGTIMGADEGDHAVCRKAFMGGFSERSVRGQMGVLERHVGGWVGRLQGMFVETGRTVDLKEWLNLLLFDVSGELSFGEVGGFGSVEGGKAHPWVEISYAFGKGFAMMASLNFLGLTSGLGGRVLGYAIPKQVRERMVYHAELTREKVREKMEVGLEGKRADFMDSVLRFNAGVEADMEKGQRKDRVISEAELARNMSILVFAGSETSSSALSATLTYLLRDREVLAKLTKEIRDKFEREEDVKVSGLAELEYLNAVISEGMRLGPPVVIGVPRAVPKGGAMVCGRFVPEDVSIIYLLNVPTALTLVSTDPRRCQSVSSLPVAQ